MIINYATIVLYFLVILGVGFLAMRRTRNTEDFAVAGRRLGPVLYSGTLAAVVLGGGATMGSARLGYEYGISGFWLVFMFGFGVLVLSLVFGRKLANLRVFTVSEMLANRYGVASRYISACIMIVYDLMIAVTATIGIGSVFDVVLGVPKFWGILIGGGIMVIYATVGGMWALTLTDILQFGVMIVGFLLVMLPLTLAKVDGVAGLVERLPASYFDPMAIGGGTIVTFLFIYFFGILIGQDVWQRAFTARSPRVTVWAGAAAGIICIVFGCAIALMGAAAKVILPNLTNTDNTLPALISEIMPVGLAGLAIAAILSALMSTASACILAVSTISTRDILSTRYGHTAKDGMAHGRLVTFVTGIVVIGLAVVVGDVLAALTIAYNLLVGGLFVPIVGAMLWKQATKWGALAGMVLGSLTVIAFMIRDGLLANEPIYYSLTVSVVVFVIVSLLTRNPDPTEVSESLSADSLGYRDEYAEKG
ncbi:sodium:solute symporter [Paeniglutamicibacter psychrophenolicus]|uniref:SSS family solute:Na+ symporter n=1 Tax=Paeniglutamicibacter psychrophenolicus TaxID=257454 RepID=A0ABS4WHE3_9MICC|nr:sodium:solute symporter [Paeniglutamicibacter psychrophenolicus]MBP2375631.1 SSS family solute:Na+ symporter [Paeniglutamicibacter psychrophenolicus]